MASGNLKSPEKAINGLRWLQKYYFLVLYKVWFHITLSIYTVIKKC